MRKITSSIKNIGNKLTSLAIRTKLKIANRRGEGYMDTAVKLLLSLVLGALLLSGLYALFGDVVMPTIEDKINEMFNYVG